MKKVIWALIVVIIGATTISIINNREHNKDFLDAELMTIQNYFGQREGNNPQVSEANVAWHLDHSLKTINRICEALIASNPEDYHSKFNIQRIVVHTTGRIPRGAAQSPQSVRPPDVILLDSLRWQLEAARTNLDKISALEEHAFFAHPVFDQLDRDQTRRFLDIHTNHHLKIIEDILDE